MTEDTEKYLECACCESRFFDGIMGPLQASNCASDVRIIKNVYFIDCGYGSIFDTNRYIIHKEDMKTKLKSKSLVCDNCIQKFLMTGDISEDKNYDFWTEMSSNLDIVENSLDFELIAKLQEEFKNGDFTEIDEF